jgi:hypothetical protein
MASTFSIVASQTSLILSQCDQMAEMTIASDLLQRHFQTLVSDNVQWQTLIADDLVWELPFAPAIGHPARLSGRAEVVRHVTGSSGQSKISVSSISMCMPSPSQQRQSLKSRRKGLSSLRGGFIAKSMYCSFVLSMARSPSYGNILILPVRPKPSRRRFLV